MNIFDSRCRTQANIIAFIATDNVEQNVVHYCHSNVKPVQWRLNADANVNYICMYLIEKMRQTHCMRRMHRYVPAATHVVLNGCYVCTCTWSRKAHNIHDCMCVMVVGFEPKSKLVCSTHTLVCLVLTYKSAMFCASRSQRDSIHLLLKLSIEIPCDPIEFLLTVLLVLVHMHGRMDCKVHKLKHPSLLYKACKQNVYILQSARSMVYTYYSRDNKRPAQDHFW